jgi:hypothetical protein
MLKIIVGLSPAEALFFYISLTNRVPERYFCLNDENYQVMKIPIKIFVHEILQIFLTKTGEF